MLRREPADLVVNEPRQAKESTMRDRAFRSYLTRMAMAVAALAVLAVPAGPALADDFDESRSQWAVAPPIGENLQPGVQRDGTLRVIRFANDRQILNDPGTVVGFTAIFARTGELSPTHPQLRDEKSILEIMRRGELDKD
jgi:hypothetical protein